MSEALLPEKTAFVRREYVAVIVGGAMGSSLREFLGPHLPDIAFLTSSAMVNICACFVLGWLFAIRLRVHAHFTHLGAVGFCGGLSTFSTFVADVHGLLKTGEWHIALLAPSIEILLGVAATLLGETLGRRVHGEVAR